MTPEQQAKAEKRLAQYANSLTEILGPHFAEHPRYKEALIELTANPGRSPSGIISDLREAHAYFNSAK